MLFSIRNELNKHKKLIIIYVSLCIFVAVLCSPFFGTPNMYHLYAFSGGDVPVSETVSELNNMFTANSMKYIAGYYAPIIGVSIEPFTALLFLGLFENINKLCGSPLNIVSTPVGNPIVLALVAVFCVASKLMKANEATKVFGTCTLGELEKYLGTAFVLIYGVMGVVGVTNMFVTNTVSAANGPGVVNTGIFAGIFAGIVSVFMAVSSFIMYLVIKTVVFGLEALQSMIPIPFSGLAFEIIKSLSVLIVIVISIFFPYISIVLGIILFIISLFFLRLCINAANFLRIIYIRPFFKRLQGFSETYPIISRKLPKKIKKALDEEGFEIRTAIPSYAYKSKETEEFKIKYMTKFWIVSDGERVDIYTKKKWRLKWYRYNLVSSDKVKLYLKKDFRFIEIFTASENKNNKLKKDTRFIISNEYQKRFDDLCQILCAEDYHIKKAELKLTKKEEKLALKELKKEQRKEFFEKSRKNIVGFFEPLDYGDYEEIE